MMEGTTSSASLTFMERPEIENIAADTFGAGDTRRGIEIGWAQTDAFWAGDNVTVTGAFTGGKTGSAPTMAPSATGRRRARNTRCWAASPTASGATASPTSRSAPAGATCLYGGNNAGGGSQTLSFRDRPEIRVDGARLIATGGIAAKTGNMYAFDAERQLENFYLGGEYAQFTMDRQCGSAHRRRLRRLHQPTTVADHPTFSGWYLEGSWILTGETKVYSPSAINNEVGGFNAPVPSRPFSLSGDSWGAWELTARYSDTNLNWQPASSPPPATGRHRRRRRERIVALGVNWYLNRNIRIMLDDNIVAGEQGHVARPRPGDRAAARTSMSSACASSTPTNRIRSIARRNQMKTISRPCWARWRLSPCHQRHRRRHHRRRLDLRLSRSSPNGPPPIRACRATA